jgi:murein DD-endopeptidase MepM/ murein hydrolase activator NlpD
MRPERPMQAQAPVSLPGAPASAAAAVSSRSLVLANTGDLAGALAAAGLSGNEVAAANAAAAQVLGAAAGEIRVVLNLVSQGDETHLDRLQASFADGSGAVVSRGADGAFAARRVAVELSRQIKVVRGELDTDSFYSSAVAAGVIDTLIPEFINAFTYDFNLASEISPGDTFEVAYEQSVTPEGRPVGPPQLLYASLVTPTKRRALYRFRKPDGSVGWFDGNGASTVSSFMRTPIDGARITSKFGMRFHPVLHYTRLHGGVDFAAPVGTPIYAAADGVVTSASPSSCAGNMVIIQHKDGYETRYFHLSRYADGVVAGLRVPQGFTVGFVGTTGVCTTGPHLHYEVHVNGEKIDPLTIRTDSGRKRLDSGILAAFIAQRDRVDVARARQAQ